LAKKVRTPPPPAPRRVQAPKKRTGPRHVGDADRRRLLIVAGAAAAGLLLGAVGVYALVGGASSSSIAETMSAAGCTYRVVEETGEARHVTELPKGYKYTTDPRTTGLHHPETVLWGAYDAPLDQMQVGHNMEHGGVVIQYGAKVPEATVAQLTAFYQADPNGLLLAPLPRLGNEISLGAWTFDLDLLNKERYAGHGRLARCSRFNEDAFDEFVGEFRGKGPERSEVDQLVPGEH
jgi:hypothetical protein